METPDRAKRLLAETMLFEGGVIARRGDVGSKTSVSDYHKIEQDNQTSMYSVSDVHGIQW